MDRQSWVQSCQTVTRKFLLWQRDQRSSERLYPQISISRLRAFVNLVILGDVWRIHIRQMSTSCIYSKIVCLVREKRAFVYFLYRNVSVSFLFQLFRQPFCSYIPSAKVIINSSNLIIWSRKCHCYPYLAKFVHNRVVTSLTSASFSFDLYGNVTLTPNIYAISVQCVAAKKCNKTEFFCIFTEEMYFIDVGIKYLWMVSLMIECQNFSDYNAQIYRGRHYCPTQPFYGRI